MKRLILLAVCLLTTAAASDTHDSATAAFDRLKTLVGEWEGDSPAGKARLTYELTAGGYALVERESAEKMPPMMTVFNLDGNRILLTHYCMTQNQPRMQATSFDPASRKIEFRFVDVANLASKDAGHMRNAVIRFIDDNHISADWEFYENGHKKFTETTTYTRVR